MRVKKQIHYETIADKRGITRCDLTGQRDKKIDTSIIIPVYNEEAALPSVLTEIFKIISRHYEVIIVDDGSTDNFLKRVQEFPCLIFSHNENLGKGKAVRDGLSHAKGENIIIMDGDGTYSAKYVPEIVRGLKEADMVFGSRILSRNRIPLFNRFGNAIFKTLIGFLYGCQPADPLTGLYGIKTASLKKMNLESVGFDLETEISIKAAAMGLKVKEIAIEYGSRIGEAKLCSLKDGYKILRTIFKYVLLYNPTVSFILPGFILMILGGGIMGFILIESVGSKTVFLGTHSFFAGSMTLFAGFQISIFGFAAKLYALVHKFTKADRITKFFLGSNMGKIMTCVGIGFVVLGLTLGFQILLPWITGGFGYFDKSVRAIFSSLFVIFGLQVTFSTFFLSILRSELMRKSNHKYGQRK